jgi:hypothetical protein
MNRENQLLVTDESIEVEDFKKIKNYFRGIYKTYPNLSKKIQNMSLYNWLDLEGNIGILTNYTQNSPRTMMKFLLNMSLHLSVLQSSPTHTPIKYRCSIKKSS